MRRGLLAVTLIVGCQLSQPYPEVATETGAERCHDGVDQDLDGKVDCADPDCAGACEEATLAECRDGLDQDGDGWIDHQDPDCWPFAAFAVDDCVSSVNPIEALPMDDETAWLGDGRLAEDVGEDGSTFPVLLGQAGQYLTSAHGTAGAVEGASVEVDFKLQGGGAFFVYLGPTDSPVSLGPLEQDILRGVLVGLGLSDLTLAGRIVPGPWIVVQAAEQFGVAEQVSVPEILPDVWSRLRVRFEDGVVRVFVDEVAPRLSWGSAVGVAPSLPAPWSEAQPLRFAWTSFDLPEVRLKGVRWSRPRHDPCGQAVPQLDGPTVGAAVDSEGRLCVLHWSERALRTISTRFDSSGGPQPMTGFVTPGLDAVDGALTWSEADRAFVGVVLLARPQGPVTEARLVRSVDCDRWTLEPSGLDAELLEACTGRGASYEILTDGVHRMQLPLQSHASIEASSATGAPGSFDWVSGGHRLRPTYFGNGEGLSPLAGHQVVVAPEAAGLRVWSDRAGRAWQAGPVLRAPSGRLGTFDATTIDWGALVGRLELDPDVPGSGWLLHQGEVPAGPTAVQRVRWSGPGSLLGSN